MPFDDRLRPEPAHEADAPKDAQAAADHADRAAAVGQSAEVLGVAADETTGVDAELTRVAAAVGLSSEAQAMPHHEAIQAAFGQHDVSDLRAHVDPKAAAAAEVMGVEAFTTGPDVAFAQAPDRAEAAAEAARALWQQQGPEVQGGVAEAGPEAELIEAIGERVGEGRTVEALVDRLLAEPEGRGQGFEGDAHAFDLWGTDGLGGAARDAAQDVDLQTDPALEQAQADHAPQTPWATQWLAQSAALSAALEAPALRGPGTGRRRRTGDGWLYTPGEGAQAPTVEAPAVTAEPARETS